MLRIIATIIIFLSVYIAPWWIAFVFLCAGILYFNFYIEGVLAALFIEWLYAPYFFQFNGHHFVLITAIFLCLITPTIKHILRV